MSGNLRDSFDRKLSEAQSERPAIRHFVMFTGIILAALGGILFNYLPFWQVFLVCLPVALALAIVQWLMTFKLKRLSSLAEATIVWDKAPTENLRELVEEVARDMEREDEARIVESSGESVVLRTPLTMKSFGEKLSLSAVEGKVKVVSRSSVPFTIIDWGKNRENVEHVRQRLSRDSGEELDEGYRSH